MMQHFPNIMTQYVIRHDTINTLIEFGRKTPKSYETEIIFLELTNFDQKELLQ